MADMDQQQWYPPNDEERRPRRHDDDYRRDRDRRHSRHRRKRSRSRSRSRSRERYGSDRRRSRRYSRSRSRSRSNSRSRSRHRNRSRDLSPQRRRSFEYGNRGDGPQRHYGMDDQEYRDYQGHMRDERYLDQVQEPESSGLSLSGGGRRNEKDWRMKLTSIRDAHFNRSKQPPPFAAQNQFQNDGSFLEMFKKKMAADNETDSSLTPNSLVLASSSIPYSSDISLPPLTAVADPKPQASTSSSADQDLDGVPMKKTTLPVPVSIGRRRCIKPLKTGVVFKKKQQTDEDEGSQEKLDAWARYLQEVQKYKKDNLVEEDGSRPLVK